MTQPIDIPDTFAEPSSVAGKRVVITGAGRGLGSVLAHAFSRSGARVALVARTEKDLKAVAADLPGPPSPSAATSPTRTSTRPSPTPPWPSGAASTCGSPTPASPRSSPVPARPTPAIWRRVLDVNLTGAFLGARAAARVMGEGGRLIFTGSVLGERPREGLTAYSASKAGLVGHGQGPRARPGALPASPSNVVAPGWFESPLAEGVE